MKVRSPLTFRNKAGNIVALGDVVDDSELKAFGLAVPPAPYETKVVREVPADDPAAPKKPAAKKAK